jgi:hypothetical protein
MANELIGEIFISRNEYDFMWDRTDPIFYGVHIIDIISTNRWPFINVTPEIIYSYQRGLRDPALLGIVKGLIPGDYDLYGEKTFNSNEKNQQSSKLDLLPSNFSPFEIYLIDVLIYLGLSFEFPVFNSNDLNELNQAWTGDNLESIKSAHDYQEIIKGINFVIEKLIGDNIRIGAISQVELPLYPKQLFSSSDFPEIQKLRFICYKP